MKQNKVKVLGVTGGIGSGKSLLLEMLSEYEGVSICRADDVARNLQKKGAICYQEIVTVFGDDILDDSKEIDRKKLSALVFADERLLETINKIVHPAVQKQIELELRESTEKGDTLFVIEAALLLEAGYQSICDEIWYVYAEEKIREDRVEKNRGVSRENFWKVLKNQKTHSEFLAECKVVIENNGSQSELRLNIKDRYKKLVGEVHEDM